MNGKHVRFALLGLAMAGALLGCPPEPSNIDIARLILGNWTASEQVELFGRTLTSTVDLAFTPSAVTLSVDILNGNTLEHRLTASGTYVVTQSQGTVSLSYASARQSADVLTPGADPASLADLSAEDLADLATDFPAALSCTIGANGTSMTLGFADAPDLIFTKATL
jgi:hypothetical protein